MSKETERSARIESALHSTDKLLWETVDCKPVYSADDFVVCEIPENYEEPGEEQAQRMEVNFFRKTGKKLIIVPHGTRMYSLPSYSIRHRIGDVEEEYHFKTFDEMLAWEKMQNSQGYKATGAYPDTPVTVTSHGQTQG